MRFGRWLAGFGLVVIIGCAPTPLPTTGVPSPSTDGVSAECSGVDLRQPNGVKVNLTGTWEGLSTLWLVTQSGSCVVIEGLSREGEERPGATLRFVFTGELRSDFSIVGRRTWTWTCSGPIGCPTLGETKAAEMHVGFANGDDTIEVPSDMCACSGTLGSEAPYTVTLVRTSMGTDIPGL